MNALIVTNGTLEDLNYLTIQASLNDFVICADGAVQYMKKINRIPEIVAGDLDSISEENLEWLKKNQVTVHQYEPRKNYTDTELAVNLAIERGAIFITLTGATGGRTDHMLANIFLLKLLYNKGVNGMIDDHREEIRLLQEGVVLSWNPGDTVSLIPLSEVVHQVSLEGFEYPLKNESLLLGSSRCISNIVTHSPVRIEMGKGLILAIRNK